MGSSEWPPARSLASSPCSASDAAPLHRGRPDVLEFGGDHAALRRSGCRGQHRAHDVVVAGAAAEVAFEALADFLLGGVRIVGEQADRRHHHPRRAEAALQPVLGAKRCRHRMQLAVFTGQPLERRHRTPVGLGGEHGARLDRLAVEQHRAGAAGRRVAADVRGLQPPRLAQVVHEQQPPRHIVGEGLTVHVNLDLHHSLAF